MAFFVSIKLDKIKEKNLLVNSSGCLSSEVRNQRTSDMLYTRRHEYKHSLVKANIDQEKKKLWPAFLRRHTLNAMESICRSFIKDDNRLLLHLTLYSSIEQLYK